MRHLGLFSYLCLTATAAAAEPPVPAPGYLRHHAETRGFMLGRPVKPRPTPDGKAVLFLRAAPRTPELRLYEFDVATARTRELVTPEQILKGAAEHLSPEERARRERMRVSLRGFTWFDLSRDGSLVLLSLSGRLYALSRQPDKDGAGPIRELQTGPTPAIDPQLSPDGKRVAYVRDRDLYVLDLATQREVRLTHSDHEHVTYGLAEFVAQEEMHRFSGFFWSPDSAQLCFEEADSRGLEIFHIGDPAHPEAAAAAVPYPRPGKANAKVRLAVVPVSGGTPTWIKWDADRYPYLATVRWSEGAPLSLVVQDRDQHDLLLLRADPRTGKTTQLLSEHDDAWLNLDQEMPCWLRDGSGFLWTTERRGGRELELRDKEGALVRVVLDKDAAYAGLLDLDEGARQAVVLTSREPSQRHILRISLDEPGAVTQLHGDAGMQGAAFSRDHSIYARTLHSLSAMPRTTVHRADGTLVGELPGVAEEPPLRPRTEISQVGPQGIRAALTRPRSFAAGRKYPVVVHVYGGPGAQTVLSQMGGYLLDQWLADHGYVVVSFDGRGTPARGRAWERAIDGNFAQVTLADQVSALQEMGKRHPEMDLQRVGIYGWSFGGYMAALAVLRRPDVFHVGVAGAPVVDWQDYDTHYTERYLGLPEKNEAGYRDSSLLTHAAGLRRPLLLIHGTGDDNVYFFHTLKLSHALFRAGKHHEVLPLLGLTHMVPDPVMTERLWERIASTLGAALRP
jgi:dipeptidyl-peptidase-4